MASIAKDGRTGHPAAVDDLEKELRRRDWRFLVRLGLKLAIALLAGLYFMLWLSNQNVGGCAARGFGTVTETPTAVPTE